MHCGIPLAATALALTCAGGFGCVSAIPIEVPTETPSGVRFVFVHPTAHAVAVAGSFNQWSASSHPLARDARGRWVATVTMPPGDHTFMFVVDGTQWLTPPAAEDYVDDGFGARNGVVVVRTMP